MSAPAIASKLTSFRLDLAAILAGDDEAFDVVDEPGAWRSLPALVLQGATPWLSFDPPGPARVGRVALNVGAFVRQVDAGATLPRLEDLVETIFSRLADAAAWRVDYVSTPTYITESDQATLSVAITVSRPYSVPLT